MRKTLVVLLSSGAAFAIGFFLIGFYSSCGNTGGGGTSVAELANQFVSLSCAPGGSRCLTLTGPGHVPADGKTLSGFGAELRDGSGAPLDNVQICFHFEDPDIAIIIEPTDNCGLTAPDGHVSGTFRDGTRPGSFTLIADAPPGFALQARTEVVFVTVFPTPGQKGDIGATCQSDLDCSTAPVKLFCTFNDSCFPGGTTCQATQPGGGCCTSGQECDSQTCDTTHKQCTTVNGGVGTTCVSNANCSKNLFCTFNDHCFPGPSTCQEKLGVQGCCTQGDECKSNTCDATKEQCTGGQIGSGGIGDACNIDKDCNSGLFCTFNDSCFPGPPTCQALRPNGACCTRDSECVETVCDTPAKTCGPGSKGVLCDDNADCQAGLFCTFNDSCFPGPSACQPLQSNGSGSCCTTGGECATGNCNTAARHCGVGNKGDKCNTDVDCAGDLFCDPASFTCQSKGAVGSSCAADADCQKGLFCGVADGCAYPANKCDAKKPSTSCCTVGVECISGTCTPGGTCM